MLGTAAQRAWWAAVAHGRSSGVAWCMRQAKQLHHPLLATRRLVLTPAHPPLLFVQGKIWRVGLMGYNAKPANVELVLAAFRDGLTQQGFLKQ